MTARPDVQKLAVDVLRADLTGAQSAPMGGSAASVTLDAGEFDDEGGANDGDEFEYPAFLIEEHLRILKYGTPVEDRPVHIRSPHDRRPTKEMLARFYRSRDTQRSLRQTRARGTSVRSAPRPRASRRHARRTRAVVRVAPSGGDPPGAGDQADAHAHEGGAP